MQFIKDVDVDFASPRPNILPAKKSVDMKIAFLIPGLPAYSGGHTSILRLGTYLSEFGYNVYYVSYRKGSLASMRKNAKINLPYYCGEILDHSHLSDDFDIGIATAWDSAYLLYARQNFAYRSYFIQNYDPTFYAYGDEYFLSKNSYYLGHKIISLGQWNKEMIEANCPGVSVAMVDYPYEPKQYSVVSRRIEIGEILRIAVFVKDNSQRAPVTILLGLSLLKDKLGDCVEINVFGLNKHYPISFGKNLGMLSHDELRNLYQRSHIGIVGSMTNVSLVPYEMIASGLPVVEFKDGSFSSFFSEKSSLLVETLPGSLCNRIINLRVNPEELNAALSNAQQELHSKTWEKTARQFESELFGTGVS